MKVAETFAQESPDEETKVGSILVHKTSGTVMGLSYNGFVSGALDHNLPKTRPEKYSYILHSELNLVCHAAKQGVRTSDCFVVCTLSPCINCLRLLYQAGINEIYYKDTYKDFEKNLSMNDLLITLTNVGKYTRIDLRSMKK